MENRVTVARFDSFHRVVSVTENILYSFSHPEKNTATLHIEMVLDALHKNSFLDSMTDLLLLLLKQSPK